jgi:hypothetical protein
VLVSPENRAKYRAQVLVGFGLYLDAYVNPKTSQWYVDGKGGPRVERLRENLDCALKAADEYIWIYGEQGRWWPVPGETAGWKGKEKYPEWPVVLPGCDRVLAFARDPVGAAREAVDGLRKAGKLVNLARNGGFDSSGGKGGGKGTDWKVGEAPPGWSTWQDDNSKGEFAWDRKEGAASPGSARASGVEQGCFIQTFKVKPGQRHAVEVSCRNTGKGQPWVVARWKDKAGHWTAESKDVHIYPGIGAAGEWRRWFGPVTVPDGAAEMILLLGVTGQYGKDETTWFDDAAVYLL